MRPHVEYVRSSDGVQIAMTRYGAGDAVPVVCTRPPQFSHLEYEWEAGASHHEYEHFALERTVVRFDPRGAGLSDRGVRNQSIEMHVADMEAVVDEMQLHRFAIDAISSSALVAVVYAARHPDRVAGLSLQNPYVRGNEWWGMAPRRALLALAPIDWTLTTENWAWLTFGSPASVTTRLLAGHIRACIEPGDFVRMARAEMEVDVTRELRSISVRTLVLNHTHFARMVPPEVVRGVARTIPHVKMVSISGLRARVDALNTFLAEIDAARSVTGVEGPPREMLTKRELEVLGLVTSGLSNRQIADHLMLSTRTVDAHVAAILRKTGLHTRVEAAGYAFRHGLASLGTRPDVSRLA